MPVNVQWGDERETYVVIEFINTWDWAAFYQALNQVNRLLEQVERSTPLVMDFSKTDHTPRGLLVRLSTLVSDLNDTGSFIYFVGLNTTMRVLMRTLRSSSQSLRNRVRILYDRPAALRDMDASGLLPAASLS